MYDNTRLTLLIKLKASDNDGAWNEFEAIYTPFIYSLIRRIGFQHHDALDLAQNVLIKVWQKIDKYDMSENTGSFRGWLTVVTHNTVSDYARTKKHFITNRDSVEFKDFYRELGELQLPQVEKLAKKEWLTFITNKAKKNVCENLHETKCKVFDMCIKNIHPKEIAEELGVTETLVYIHRKEVYQKMKDEINRLNNEL